MNSCCSKSLVALLASPFCLSGCASLLNLQDDYSLPEKSGTISIHYTVQKGRCASYAGSRLGTARYPAKVTLEGVHLETEMCVSLSAPYPEEVALEELRHIFRKAVGKNPSWIGHRGYTQMIDDGKIDKAQYDQWIEWVKKEDVYVGVH